MKVCQYPVLLSTKFFPSNQRKNLTFSFHFSVPFQLKIFSQKSFPKSFPQNKKMSDSEDEIPRYSPQLVRETYTTNTVPKNPRVEYFKEIIRKIRGKTNFHSKILNFINPKFSPKFHLLKSPGKKVRDFCKASRWRVNGNEHTIFNYIIDPDGNDYLPYEDLEDFLIDDFKHFSLAYNELNLPRKRFLNCHHVLFWLLKKNGFHPNEEDFKLLILPQKRAEQEKIIQTIFKNIIGKKMASKSESLGSQDSSRSEDETQPPLTKNLLSRTPKWRKPNKRNWKKTILNFFMNLLSIFGRKTNLLKRNSQNKTIFSGKFTRN